MTTPAASRAFVPGGRVGKVRLGRHLATGGMAEVFVARTLGMEGAGKRVACKTLLPGLADDARAIEMFLAEARLQAGFSHPNLVTVLDIDRQDGQPYYTMELIDGPDLRRLLERARDRGERLPLDVAITIALGILAGLHHAHEQRDATGAPLNLVHRDVSPTNVLVGRGGQVKLIDFGVAKAGQGAALTQEGMIKGKVAYMSPEQCRGEALDRRSDVFAAGLVLHELTTGQHPFPDETEYGLLRALGERDVPPPSSIVPDYPPALERILLRALARDRRGRYPTAEALQIDLETFARDARLSISPVELGRTVDELCPPEPAPEELEAPADADAARLQEASPVSRSRARGLGRALVRWRLALVLAVPLIAVGGLAWRAFAPGVRCGDGVVDAGEQCDDGNDRDSDGCLRSCRFARCGDGLVRAGVEECDPAAPGAAASCSSSCLRCGGDGASFAHPETGHCYALVATPAPWSRARTNCGLAGGYLATYATSRETREVFEGLVSRAPAPLWMSRFRAIERESGGVWDNDERLPAASLFRIWEGPPAEPEGCFLQILRMGVEQQNPAVVWRATPCNEPAPYLCEREGWIIRPRDNHAYRLFRLGHTWKAAEEACRKIGAHLVTVGDADEESFVEANFAGTRWLGASDLREEGKFRWVTGEPFTFGDWAPREPDQSTGDDDCLALDVDGVWHDRRCGMGNAFVCEAE